MSLVVRTHSTAPANGTDKDDTGVIPRPNIMQLDVHVGCRSSKLWHNSVSAFYVQKNDKVDSSQLQIVIARYNARTTVPILKLKRRNKQVILQYVGKQCLDAVALSWKFI